MIHRAGSHRVRRRFEKQTRENMDLKMHIKSRKMAEKECREAGLGAKQRRAGRAQCPCGCAGGDRKGSRAWALVRLHREKDELIAIPAL